jgi:hypothetical protein
VVPCFPLYLLVFRALPRAAERRYGGFLLPVRGQKFGTSMEGQVIHMNKRNAVLIGVLSLLTASAGADFGKSGWPIFRKIQSAQCKAVTAAAPSHASLSSVLYNPAVSGAADEQELLFISEAGMAEEKLGCALYSQPLQRGTLTAGLAYYDAGSVELNWMDAGTLHTRTACAQRDMLGMVAYAHRLSNKFFGGLSLKAATSEIAETRTATAIAADVGMYYRPTAALAFSIAAQNMGVSSKFIDKENPLPTAAYVGGACLLGTAKSYLMPAVGMTWLTQDEKAIAEAGVELGYEFLSLNAGYRFGMQEANMHCGLQVRLHSIVFGYAFVPGVYLDATHRMNISFKFGKIHRFSGAAVRQKSLRMNAATRVTEKDLFNKWLKSY